MTRTVKLDDDFARLLSLAIRGAKASPQPLVAEQIEAVETQFDCTIPDPVLAYYAAGLAGHYEARTYASVLAMRELTLDFRDTAEDQSNRGYGPRYDPAAYVMFEYDNANFLGFATDADRTDSSIYFFDHEGMYTDPPIAMELADRLDQFVAMIDANEKVEKSDVEPFTVEVVTRPEPVDTSTDEPDIRVRHASFGPGRVIRIDRDGRREKWLVEFESGEEKLLLADFLEEI